MWSPDCQTWLSCQIQVEHVFTSVKRWNALLLWSYSRMSPCRDRRGQQCNNSIRCLTAWSTVMKNDRHQKQMTFTDWHGCCQMLKTRCVYFHRNVPFSVITDFTSATHQFQGRQDGDLSLGLSSRDPFFVKEEVKDWWLDFLKYLHCCIYLYFPGKWDYSSRLMIVVFSWTV